MQSIETIRAMQGWSEQSHKAAHSIGLVPTMGALHEGHLSLVRIAREQADRVVASSFVNPIQFNSTSDFEGYPRDEARDIDLLARSGVDVLFCPTVKEMYPEGSETRVEVTEISKPLCGTQRPGHFLGVTTVVAKLLLAVKPDTIVFGEKDYQQLQVVKRMVRDLNFDVTVLSGPTVREADGLAMSSRNQRLSPSSRTAAGAIPRGLEAARQAAQAGEREPLELIRAFRRVLEPTKLMVEYAELRNAEDLSLVEKLERAAVLFVSVWADDVRLIDNIRIEVPGSNQVALGENL